MVWAGAAGGDARGPRGKDFTAGLGDRAGDSHKAATAERPWATTEPPPAAPGAVLHRVGSGTVSRAAWASDQLAPRVDSGAEGPAGSMSARCFPAAGSPLWRNR